MCGIFGFISKSRINDELVLQCKKGLSLLQHRGPDAENYYYSDYIFLGHRRLSIIDLSEAANQPFFSGCGKAAIVFNGEVYNYKDLRQGLNVRTNSDTEVLLEGYLKYGNSFFKRIRGIYALAIYDFRTANPTLTLLRDPSGIKPLYVYRHNEDLVFGSEIKAIIPVVKNHLTIREKSIWSYLHLSYIPEPYTIYDQIHAHTPGLLETYSLNDLSCSSTQLNSFDFLSRNHLSFKDNVLETSNLLQQAVKRNLVSDVSLKMALSGGIDSSLLYALSNKQQSVGGISVSMDELEYNEAGIAKVYAKHLNAPLEVINLDIDNRLDLLNRLLLHFDQPYADSSLVPFYFLTKAASEKTKVLIGGDGGDEIQNGYSGFKSLPLLLNLRRILPNSLFSNLYNHSTLFPERLVRIYNKAIGLIDSSSSEELLLKWGSWLPAVPKQYPFNPFLRSIENNDQLFESNEKLDDKGLIVKYYYHHRMQSDYLRKSDMMSMINGVEYRVPMLDEDLVNFSLSVPYNQKSDFKRTKKILRSIHSQTYPVSTSKMVKKGFSIPLDTWLGEKNLQYVKNEILRTDGIVKDYIRTKYIDVLFKTLTNRTLQRYCSRATAYQRILILYALQNWYFNLKR
ncbi:MAG: asparagine synthase (glutamine-hydrolyzing) [Cyclobacteriaceae bacterium]|nr:asparagine synthase (glutamine-hydrolyzing) [Cyclobacteriaceae bacterium]